VVDTALPNDVAFKECSTSGAGVRKGGWPEELIQKLMAHSDRDMTAHYLDRHEMPWTKIKID